MHIEKNAGLKIYQALSYPIGFYDAPCQDISVNRMTSFAFLFKGGLRTSELTKEYSKRFVEWASKVTSSKTEGRRFKQEGRVVSTKGAGTIDFGSDTVGRYIIVEADSYEKAVEIAKGCPILENNGTVEIREIVPRDG